MSSTVAVVKKQAKQVIALLKSELATLKEKKMSKEERKKMREDWEKLYWASMAEGTSLAEERELEETYAKMVYQMAKNELGMHRIAEIQQLLSHFKEPGLNWENETSYARLIVKTIIEK